MLSAQRKHAIERTASLLMRHTKSDRKKSRNGREKLRHEKRPSNEQGSLAETFAQAGLHLPPKLTVGFIGVLGICAAGYSYLSFSPYLAPLVLGSAWYLPYSWLNARITKRATEFAADYPNVLLAMASSLKAGMTPLSALDRTTELLPKNSIIATEIRSLINQLQGGSSRKEALATFASNISQADLELFRSAFLLVLENGGRFSPTLERLAEVSKERSALIGSARVRTASMRMTANILIGICPCILFVISGQTENFWGTIAQNQTANALAITGGSIVVAGYFLLRHMSDFRP